MPDPFYAKTKPRWIGSSPLGGKPVLRGKKAMTERGIPARRGIRARHWVWTIRQKHEENFKKAVRKAVLEGLEAATLPRGR